MQREVNALVALHSLYPLKKAMIVTYEDEGELECKGLKIEIVPMWKWVLENNIEGNQNFDNLKSMTSGSLCTLFNR